MTGFSRRSQFFLLTRPRTHYRWLRVIERWVVFNFFSTMLLIRWDFDCCRIVSFTWYRSKDHCNQKDSEKGLHGVSAGKKRTINERNKLAYAKTYLLWSVIIIHFHLKCLASFKKKGLFHFLLRFRLVCSLKGN